MILETLKQFNWLDILVVILALKICYVAIKGGFLVEFFKILGTISSIYLSFHYFSNLSDFVAESAPVNAIPKEFLDFLSLLILAIVGYLLFVILRLVILRFIKMEAVPKLSRWGGFILGLGRVFLFTSLIIFLMFMSTIGYFKRSIETSYSARYLFKIAPSVYSSLWNGFASKVIPQEKFNQAILEIQIPDSDQESL